MKKILLMWFLSLSAVLTACSGSGAENTETVEWSREGYFVDDNENVLIVMKSDNQEEYPGWSVSFFVDGDVHGWFIQQNGNKLEGNLTSEYLDEPAYEVAIEEEGADGLLLVTKADKKEYHLKRMEVPEVIASLTVNTEGLGQIAVGEIDAEVIFDDEYPYQSYVSNIAEPETFRIGAKAEEGWKFVKWLCNGEEYSTEEIISVFVEENMDLVAVFDLED